MKNWHGLMKILEIQHVRNGKVIWEDKNILNIFHTGGELYMLTCCFDNPGSLPVANYYFGLDSRSSIATTDLITNLTGEPNSNGYSRVAVPSNGNFTLDFVNGIYRATSQILTFTATGSGWGPVTNLFLATTIDNSGILIASSPLSSATSLSAGDSINMRMALSLQDNS